VFYYFVFSNKYLTGRGLYVQYIIPTV